MKKVVAAVLIATLLIALCLAKGATNYSHKGEVRCIPIQISEKQEAPGRTILVPINIGEQFSYIPTKTRDRFYVSGFDEEGNKHTVEVNVREYIGLDIGDEYYIEP